MKIFICIALISIFNVSASAWHTTEHEVVAEIAWRQMTPKAREKAVKLLFAAPEDAGVLDMCPLPFDISSEERGRQFFDKIANWADLLNDPRFPLRKAKYNAWNHHIDYFFTGTSGVDARDLNDREPTSKDINSIKALFAVKKVLQNRDATDGEKGVALAWFIHIAGDMHQPLHNAARVTDTEPDGDQGGNTFLLNPPIKPNERPMNLHRYWDGTFRRALPRRNGETDVNYTLRCADVLMEKFPAKNFASIAKDGKFDEWSREGVEIAKTKLYPASLVRNQSPPKSYEKMTARIAEERIALAGYRVALRLNQIFGD